MQIQWNQIIHEIRATSPSYLLAVSGGVDSIFMLRFMAKNSGSALRVAHFNHGLRQQSAEEEVLVRDICRELRIECQVGYGDPDAMRSASSLEAEARRQRYAFFDSIKVSDELIVTGHHANDQLETIMLRLMRGYPHDRLRMQQRSGDRYRPFLHVPKTEIVSQATRRGYRWLEDSSNGDIRHERNWVRHVLIPEMSKGRNILKSMVYSSLEAESGADVAAEVTVTPDSNPRPSGSRPPGHEFDSRRHSIDASPVAILEAMHSRNVNMNNRPLTPDEIAWANANADAVRALMGPPMAKADGRPALAGDLVYDTAAHLVSSMKALVVKIESEVERKRSRLSRMAKMADDQQAAEESRAYAIERLERDRPEYEEEIATGERHIEALRSKIATLSERPEDMMLPIGTVVRFTGVPGYANSLSLTDNRDDYPEAGTVGVVTRLRRDGEHVLGVSVRSPFKDRRGCEFEPEDDRFPTYKVDLDMVEVVGYGLLPDGEEYQGYGFQRTHLSDDTVDIEEMVLEADGHFWRFHDFGGKQGIEALQAFDSMDEMPWIVGPAEEYASAVTRRQDTSSPKP